MVRKFFTHVETWVFDLDNTLYPPHMALFGEIEEKMTALVMRELNVTKSEANHLRGKYWAEYGTTLAGLMAHHAIDPERYLIEVHNISLHSLQEDPHLRACIETLPGRKVVYAERVIDARGLAGIFDDVFGVEQANYEPKPRQSAFEIVFSKAKLNPERAAMFEDDVRNLVVPHALGMRTVHVSPEHHPADYIHHHTNDLGAFLTRLL